ncbi:unnamed protein product [Prunus armeniaca]
MAVETKFQHSFGGTGCLRHASEFVSDHERHVDIEPVSNNLLACFTWLRASHKVRRIHFLLLLLGCSA